MNALKTVNDAIYRVVRVMMMSLLVVIAVLVFTAVITRATGISLPWTEELSIYCFSWLTYFGAAVVLRNNDHIAINSFVNLIRSPAAKKAVVILGQVIILVFACATVYMAAQMVLQFHTNDLRATNLTWLKMSLVFLQVPVSSAIYALFMAERIALTITGKEGA